MNVKVILMILTAITAIIAFLRFIYDFLHPNDDKKNDDKKNRVILMILFLCVIAFGTLCIIIINNDLNNLNEKYDRQKKTLAEFAANIQKKNDRMTQMMQRENDAQVQIAALTTQVISGNIFVYDVLNTCSSCLRSLSEINDVVAEGMNSTDIEMIDVTLLYNENSITEEIKDILISHVQNEKGLLDRINVLKNVLKRNINHILDLIENRIDNATRQQYIEIRNAAIIQ